MGGKGNVVTGQLTRRDVLERGGALLGGISAATGGAVADRSQAADIAGWVTKGSRAAVDGQSVVVEAIEDPGTTMCNTGELYRCRTCSGTKCYLLVGFGTPQPSVGDTYRFVATGEDNWCGNFRVELRLGTPCAGSSAPASEEGPAEDQSSRDQAAEDGAAEEPATEDEAGENGAPEDGPAEESVAENGAAGDDAAEDEAGPADEASAPTTDDATTETTPESTTETAPESTTETTSEATTETTTAEPAPDATTETSAETTTETTETTRTTTESAPDAPNDATTETTTDAAGADDENASDTTS